VGRRADLNEKTRQLPATPGVYLMKDSKGRTIYVGKARSLRDRVSSYFQPGAQHDVKTATMVEQVCDFETLDTESEVDALLVEARLVKDVQPKYNVELRDDKSFPFLEVTRQEDFPRVRVTRDTRDRKSRYYGPFPHVYELRQAVAALQRVFRFRTCGLDIDANDEKRRYVRPCLLHHIARCTAPCADRISRREYRRDIAALCRFLDGKRKSVIRSLTARMKRASEALAFEHAAGLRDMIHDLEALSDRGVFGEYFGGEIVPAESRDACEKLGELVDLGRKVRTIEGVDIALIAGTDAVGSVVTFVDGKPFKTGYRRFKIRTVEGTDDYAMIGEVVGRRLRRIEKEALPVPDILLIDGGAGQLSSAVATVERVGVRPGRVVTLAKREERVFVEGRDDSIKLPRNSPVLQLLQCVRDEAHRFAQHYHHVLRRKTVFGEK
jgi:excinuclease ABC subunit C